MLERLRAWLKQWFSPEAGSEGVDRPSRPGISTPSGPERPYPVAIPVEYRLMATPQPERPVSVIRRQIPRSQAVPLPVYSRSVRRHHIKVKPRESLWQDRGWVKDDNGWRGVYLVGQRSWQGSAVATQGSALDMYIKAPPQGLLTGPHRRCYIDKGREKGYWVHFYPTAPKNLSQAIGAIELHLAEAL